MSNEIANRPRAGAAAAVHPLDPPKLSVRLAAALDAVVNPHPDLGVSVPSLPHHTRVEAEHALRRQEELCAAAGAGRVRKWLLPLNGVVRNPASQEDFEKRAAAMSFLLADLPIAVFTVRTQRMAMAEFQFWPSAADAHKLLREQAAPLMSRRDALKRLLTAPPASPRESLTAEERDRIVRKFRADMAAVAAERPSYEERRPVAKPAHLSGEALARLRRAAGVPILHERPATE